MQLPSALEGYSRFGLFILTNALQMGRHLISGHNDCLIRIWDLAGGGGRVTATMAGHKGWVWCVSPYGDYTEPTVIVSGATDSKVMWWDR